MVNNFDDVNPKDAGSTDAEKMMEQIHKLRSMLEVVTEFYNLKGTYYKIAFDAFNKNGFTQAQTMQILSTRGIDNI